MFCTSFISPTWWGFFRTQLSKPRMCWIWVLRSIYVNFIVINYSMPGNIWKNFQRQWLKYFLLYYIIISCLPFFFTFIISLSLACVFNQDSISDGFYLRHGSDKVPDTWFLSLLLPFLWSLWAQFQHVPVFLSCEMGCHTWLAQLSYNAAPAEQTFKKLLGAH